MNSEAILQQMLGVGQPQKRFLVILFPTILLLYDQVNFTGMILLMFRYGLRTAELVALKWSQIDLSGGYIKNHRFYFNSEPKLGKLDKTCALTKYYSAWLGNPILLTVNDGMVQVDIFLPIATCRRINFK